MTPDPAPPTPETNLFLAIQANDGVTVRALLAERPELFGALSPLGVSPVLFATYYQKHDIARLLIELGAPLSVFEAAASGELARLREWLARDPALAQANSPDGFTALGLAAFFGRTEVAAELLLGGADVNATSQNAMQVRPLHSAVAGNHAALAKLLVGAGADVNAPQPGGLTPLMGAAQSSNLELVEFLLLHGANAHAQTEDGRSALSIAQEEQRTEVAALVAARLGEI